MEYRCIENQCMSVLSFENQCMHECMEYLCIENQCMNVSVY